MIQDFNTMPYLTFKRLVAASEAAEDNTARTTAVLAILTGRSEDELMDLPLLEYSRLTQMAQFVTEMPAPVPVRSEYRIGEWVLQPTLKMEQMTAGQYIDFQTFVKDESKEIELLSCLLVPKGKHYCEDYDIAELQAALRVGLMTRDAIALRSFFTASSVASIPHTLTSLGVTRKKLTREERRKMRKALRAIRSLKNGAGSLSRMPFLRLAAALGRPLSD